MYKLRVAVGVVVLTLVLFFLGVGELWRCLRTVLPPSEVSYADASAKGLGGYGYVRLTGVRPGVERATAIVKRSKDAFGNREEDWDGVFVPIGPATAEGVDDGDRAAGPTSSASAAPEGKYRVLAYVPDARGVDDVVPLVGATELLCFVDTTFPNLNPGYQSLVKSLAGSRGENCWVVKVRKPSWLKGLGLTGAAAGIVCAFVAWRIRQPL